MQVKEQVAGRVVVRGARLHNLKNISLEIPKKKLVVFTGLSGSGKSTLVFDLLHKEGLRQYFEALGMVTYALSKPPVDSIRGLSAPIAVEQGLSNHSPRSTVGTATEIFSYLRILYARLGHRPCPSCGQDIPPTFQDESAVPDETGETELNENGEEVVLIPCPHCGHLVPEMNMGYFSFNKPEGACPTCTGLGTIYQANLDRIIDMNRSVLEGAVLSWDEFFINYYKTTLLAAAEHYSFPLDLSIPVREYGPVQRDLLLYGVNSPQFRRHYPDVKPPETVRKGLFHGVVTSLLRRHEEHADNASYREKIEQLLIQRTCPDCEGTRLKPESRQVTVCGRNIVEISRLNLVELQDWLETLEGRLNKDEWLIAEPIVEELRDRLRRFNHVGVGYLTLDRDSPSLSAGEGQRLRLASLLGSGLSDMIYVLDEPTLGLHARDNEMLIQVLHELRDLGNSVFVIEHDPDVIRSADYVIDFGPGAGKHGGTVVAAGTPDEVSASPDSITGGFLAGRLSIPVPKNRRPGNGKYLEIIGARQHNLKNISLRLPLGTFICVTGVSGSGKSSLIFDILDRAARQHYYQAGPFPGEHDAIHGWEHLDKVITIDQSPIGRSPRSNAATYTDAFSAIRTAFAAAPEARRLGLKASHFSFNVPGGRCERCEGSGTLTISMHFLPDVQVRCPVCRGQRYRSEVLEVKYGGYTIAEILDMTIEEALEVFKDVPAAASRLSVMVEVGLGYLQLGQPATTLSGGEAQRVKLAKELGRRTARSTLYLLDEPSTGLHSGDIQHLLAIFQRLVDAGSTVIVVEHNLDVIKVADWVVDLGPEGGDAGGYIVAQGTPEQVARESGSHTGRFLQSLV